MLRPFEPSSTDVQRMIGDLARVVGSQTQVAEFLGTTYRVTAAWCSMERNPSGAARRAIWLLWVILCRPRRRITVGDLLTWGRVSASRERKAEVCRHPGWDFEI